MNLVVWDHNCTLLYSLLEEQLRPNKFYPLIKKFADHQMKHLYEDIELEMEELE